MKITHNNKTINLTNNDFLSEGGEGKIYRIGKILYKIFHKKPIPQQKISELKKLDKPNIMNPIDPIYSGGNYIGFSMNFVDNTIPLCKLFTTAFWQSNNITIKQILNLIKNLQDDIQFVHSENCLIVDMNEFNFLVDQSNFTNPYFIDVDSYQTPKHPATAIMNSIKDWHSAKFSELTDWYSFAILTCQLLVGIHPFKGKHPNYGKKDLKKRMLDNISIFNDKTRVPISTRDFSHIPNDYKLWFIDLFEKGNRSLPPLKIGAVQIRTKSLDIDYIKGGLKIELLHDFGHSINLSEKKKSITISGDTISFSIDKGYLNLFDKFGNFLSNIQAKELLTSENKLFVINRNVISEVIILGESKNNIISLGKSWNILPYASKIFDGFLYQNIIGKAHFDFFFTKNKKTNHSIIPIPELDGYKIVDGKHENRICVVIGFKAGKYDEFIFKFDNDYSKYICHKTEDVDSQDINMTVLDKGVALLMGEEKLRLLSNRLGDNSVKIIEDSRLNSNMRLCHKGDQAQFYIGNKLYKISMER